MEEEQSEIKQEIPTKGKLILIAIAQFDASKDGTGQNNFDQMADSLENLKSHLKRDLIKDNKREVLKGIEKRILWFRTIERDRRNYRSTPDGMQLDPNLDIKANRILTSCREILQAFAEDKGYL